MTVSRHGKAIVGPRKAISIRKMYSRDSTVIAPICPNCAKALHHPRIVLRMGSSTFYSYYCEDCGEAVTDTAEGNRCRIVASR